MKIFGKQLDDKDKHIILCMGIASYIAILMYVILDHSTEWSVQANYFCSLLIAFLVTGIIAALKEIVYDGLLKQGVASWADFLASMYGDFLGTVTSAIILGVILSH